MNIIILPVKNDILFLPISNEMILFRDLNLKILETIVEGPKIGPQSQCPISSFIFSSSAISAS